MSDGSVPDSLIFRESKHIHYFTHVKYVLSEDAWFLTPFRGYKGKTEFVELFKSGWVCVQAGWAWDGASGPTIDTKSSIRASLAHDLGAMLMRQEILPRELWFQNDRMLERLCLEDGMWGWRAKAWRKFLSLVKGAYGRPEKKRVVHVAP